MIIDSLQIYGFGKLADTEINLSSGINIIEGRNEAGKSTLMAFVRAILFGFASRRNLHERYEPIDGGKFGGKLFLTADNGEKYIIERIYTQKISGDVVITLPSGEQAGEEQLPSIIGKINENIFRQVFSFGLMELQQIELLNDDQINDFIYHVGTGSVNQILKMKKEIENKKNALFLPSGRNPLINQLLKSLDEISEQIRELDKEADKYADYRQEAANLKKEIKRHEEQLAELGQSLTDKEKYIQVHETYIELKKVELDLANYPENFKFPEDGLRRLEDAQSQLDKLIAKESELNERVKLLQKQMIDLKEDESLHSQSSQIKYLESLLAFYIESLKKEQSYLGRIELIESRIFDNLSSIGNDYDEKFVRDFEITIQDKDQLQNSYTILEKQKQEIAELTREAERVEQAEAETLNAISVIKQEDESIKEADVLIAEFPSIRNNWFDLNENRMEQRHKEEQLTLYQEQLSLQTKPLLLGNFFIVLFTIIAAVFSFYYLETPLIIGLVILIGLIATATYNLLRHTENRRNKQSINNQLASVTEQLKGLMTKENELIERIEPTFRKQGFTELDNSAFYRLEQNYNLELSKSLIRMGEQKRIGEYEKELKNIKSKQERLKERLATSDKEHRTLKTELQDWIVSKSLPAKINFNTLNSLIGIIERTKESIAQKDSLTKELAETRNFLAEYRANINKLYGAAKLPEDKALDQHVNELSERLTTYNDNLLQNKNNQERITEAEITLQQNKEEIKLLRTTIKELIDHAQVADVEEFYSAASKFKKYRELIHKREQLLLSIKVRINTSKENVDLISALDNVDFNELIEDVEILEVEQYKLIKLNKEYLVKSGELQAQIKTMETDTRSSELINEYEQLRAELGQASKDWLGYAYSERLLEQTMKLYEEEKQPNILRKAAVLFSKMTENRYTKLISPIGSNKLRVIRADGEQFEPQFLSRGTVEQLFLAIRYALIDEYSQQYRLPIMLDDVLVNFDEYRLASAIEIIKELAQKHQVIIFTCHPELTKILKDADDNVYNTKLA